MSYPTPSKRRRHSSASNADYDDDKATWKKYKANAGPKESKAEKRFEKAVLRVVDDPKAHGKYVQHTTAVLFQQTYNQYSLFKTDAGAIGSGASYTFAPSDFEFFSPRQIKDAEGVLFNNKVGTGNSWAVDVAEGANANYPAQTITSVNSMSAEFRFKNVSLHKCVVEMYICKGLNGNGTHPLDDWKNGIDAGQIFYSYGNTPARYTDTTLAPTHPFVQLTDQHPVNSMWDIEKIVFKFEPGEEAYHKLTGASNYMFDGGKKVTATTLVGSTPTWLQPNVKGCGTYVFFRYINNFSIIVGSNATSDKNPITNVAMSVGHPVNVVKTTPLTGLDTLQAGGVAVDIKRHYHITAPEGVIAKNVYAICENYPIVVNPRDQEIDQDQPGTLNYGELA